MKPYRMSEDLVCKILKTSSSNGLSTDEFYSKQKQFGSNSLPEEGPDPWIKIFIRQFQNPLIYILLVAALIIFFLGPDKIDAFIITGILLFNALIGTIQEGRTSRMLAGLRQFIVSDCIVIRDGITKVINAEQLVPGDIVILQEGQRVPADMRLIVAHNLQVDEAILTGESAEIQKNSAVLNNEDVPVMEQTNMLFKGTYILAGSGRAVVTATGLATEVGKIHLSAQEIQTDIPLKKELDRLSGWILLFVLSVCSILLIAGIIIGKPIKELLVTITALFICVVPEGLPVVLTLVLVSGVYKMAKLRVLVKKLQAVETLGRTDVIVVDKTGTLTRNEMMVTHVWADDIHWRVTGQGYDPQGEIFNNTVPVENFEPYEDLRMIGTVAILLNNAQIGPDLQYGRFNIKGDPTEAALAVFGKKLGFSYQDIEKEWVKEGEVPFDSRLKYHAVICRNDHKVFAFVSGAPETIFAWLTDVSHRTHEELGIFLSEGLRVVAFAYTEVDLKSFDDFKGNHDLLEKIITHDLKFLGMCGIQDAIRPDVANVIQDTRRAGLHVIMATGDHQKTALYVARKVGIYREGDNAVNGCDWDQFSGAQLDDIVRVATVYSRVSPANKLKLIRALHKQGYVVAMTGDGVNDVPSLVAADIGVAMGAIGTEIAQEVADVVLLDNSFVHIVTAIKQGRHIFYTLRRVVLYFFATNMGEVLIMLFAMSYIFINPSFPLPFVASQILWLNLITDGFLDMALSMEPYEVGLLEKGMITKNKHIVDGAILRKTLYMALPMAVGSLGIFMHYYQSNITYARTMALMSMAMFQWFNAWNCRSEKQSIFSLGLFTNPWLILGTVFVFFLQLLIVYVPFFQVIFKTVALSVCDWFIIFSIASSIIFFEEFRKFCVRYLGGRERH